MFSDEKTITSTAAGFMLCLVCLHPKDYAVDRATITNAAFDCYI
jgi:hypothetical protein